MKVPEDRDRLTFCGFKKREPLQFSNVRFGPKSAVVYGSAKPTFIGEISTGKVGEADKIDELFGPTFCVFSLTYRRERVLF